MQIEDEEREFLSWDVGNLKMSRKDLEKILKEFYIFKIHSNLIQDGFQNEEGEEEVMKWYCEPGKWEVPFNAEAETEGYGGSWEILDGGERMIIRPDSKKDFWRRTYYTPLLIKDDGPCYMRSLPANLKCTMEVFFTIRAFRQFDQGGLMIRFD